MSSQAIDKSDVEHQFRRELGTYGGQTAGPLVICIGGIHGNEPAGALALQRVLRRLHEAAPPFKGELVAFAGNLGALNGGTRYLSRDLNRMWTPERLDLLKDQACGAPTDSEEQEQRELSAVIWSALTRKCGDVIFLDLHTTSSEGAPFAVISDTLINRHLAMRLGVPVILGLEENLDGTILNYINEFGYAAVGFEAGQHQAPSSVENHEAAIWLTMVEAGCLPPEDAPDLLALRRKLTQASSGLPPVLELRYRHAIQETDEFVMEPGYTNFQRVQKGQALAKDRRGEVRAPESGLLFMPLYQRQGEDGFFLVREVRLFWLKVSAWMRHRKLDRILPWLPGVNPLPDDQSALAIDTRIARWRLIEICHLLGFRKHSQEQGRLIVRRRRQSPEQRNGAA
ncbi:MAG TPA: succinylglutamate desuccinylase/aspartoacylase family protein [Pyrinomonadaceae bacterium]|nr:succinylglutamate desuccinylase/aspartoacylase family protein [Pyrinomonadaceae bacterium]